MTNPVPDAKRPIKVSVTLPRTTFEQIKALAARSGSSLSYVVRRAIHTERLLRDVRHGGGRILIQNKATKAFREVLFRHV